MRVGLNIMVCVEHRPDFDGAQSCYIVIWAHTKTAAKMRQNFIQFDLLAHDVNWAVPVSD